MNEQMAAHVGGGDRERLADRVAEDPGAASFPALAELHRRAGDAFRAESVARAGLARRPDALAGRVALGLALLDLGRVDEARAELERVLASVPDHPLASEALARSGSEAFAAPSGASGAVSRVDAAAEAEELGDPIGDPEIDEAFAGARAEPREPVTPDRVAEDALLEAEAEPDEPSADTGDAEGWEAEPDGAPAAADTDAELPVATRTVADLLERQGHGARAAAMRAGLDRPRGPGRADDDPSAAPPEPASASDRDRILATLERWLHNLRGERR